MRSRIFLYLFIFAMLYILFQYSNAKAVYTSQDTIITNQRAQVKRYKTENDSLMSIAQNTGSFTLANNTYASDYFEKQGISAEEVNTLLETAIIDKNKVDADNDLVPYEGMGGTMRINNIQVVNNKWILANFTDGTYWGDLFLTYTIDKGEVILQTKEHVLFPKYE